MVDSAGEGSLRPLGVGEQLDAAFKIYRRRFKTLVLCVLVPVVPITILSTLVTASTNENAFDPNATTTEFNGAMAAGTLVTTLLTVLLALIATGACTRAVAADYLGEDLSWKASLSFAARKVLPLVLLSILVVLASTLGLVLLLIGAIYVAIRLTASAPALLIEDAGVTGAMRRSWALVKGNWWRTFAVVFVSSLLVFVISALVSGLLFAPLFAGSESEVLVATSITLGGILSNALTLPLQAAVLTVLYFDLRVRNEGFDLQLLARDMGGTSPEAVGQSAGLGTEPSAGGFLPPRASEERGSL